MNEIISLGAYVPFTALPLFAQDEIKKEFAYLRSSELDDFNTECYLLHDSDHGFTVNVQYVYSDDEPPAEKSGSVIPIHGRSESSIPILTSTCAKSITAMPLHIR